MCHLKFISFESDFALICWYALSKIYSESNYEWTATSEVEKRDVSSSVAVFWEGRAKLNSKACILEFLEVKIILSDSYKNIGGWEYRKQIQSGGKVIM